MANRNSTPHSTRVAIYCRVSTLDQSTDSQLLDLKRYIQERGWNIFKEYCDNGISGTRSTTRIMHKGASFLTFDRDLADAAEALRFPLYRL